MYSTCTQQCIVQYMYTAMYCTVHVHSNVLYSTCTQWMCCGTCRPCDSQPPELHSCRTGPSHPLAVRTCSWRNTTIQHNEQNRVMYGKRIEGGSN